MSTGGLSVVAHGGPRATPEATAPSLCLDERPWLSPEASFHTVGLKGILFDYGRQKLYSMNRSASFLWCCLAEGCTPRQAASALAMRAQLAVPEAERQTAAALGIWQGIGLAAPEAGRVTGLRGFEMAGFFPEPGAVPDAPPNDGPDPASSDTIVCRALGSTFTVTFADESLKAAVAPVLVGLACDGHSGGVRLDVIHSYRGRVALVHGGAARWVGPRSRLAPMVFTTLLRLALERSGAFPAIRAAAALGRRGAVLLAGPPDSGKSTLAAALLSYRHKVLCDDAVVLDMESMRVHPAAPVLSLKSGSWRALERRLPRLRRQPGYQRPDGTLVRFLTLERPSAGPRPDDQPHGLPVAAIVFPVYRPDRPVRLKPIGAAAALLRLTRCLDPIGHRLRADDIDRLIEWIGRTECYALSTDSLEDSVSAVSDLLQ